MFVCVDFLIETAQNNSESEKISCASQFAISFNVAMMAVATTKKIFSVLLKLLLGCCFAQRIDGIREG